MLLPLVCKFEYNREDLYKPDNKDKDVLHIERERERDCSCKGDTNWLRFARTNYYNSAVLPNRSRRQNRPHCMGYHHVFHTYGKVQRSQNRLYFSLWVFLFVRTICELFTPVHTTCYTTLRLPRIIYIYVGCRNCASGSINNLQLRDTNWFPNTIRSNYISLINRLRIDRISNAPFYVLNF